MTALELLSTLREAAHSLIAVLGAIAASGALILFLLSTLGVHGVNGQVTTITGICGTAAVLLSKFIDSLNNAITNAPVPTVVTNVTPVPTVLPQGVPT